MKPLIFYIESAFSKAVEEAKKFFDFGIQKCGRPFEAAMYPVMHIKLGHDVKKTPLEKVGLDEVGHVIVMDVAIPPDEAKNYSEGHAGFKSRKLNKINRFFNDQIEEIISRNPLLELVGKQHSHPFSQEPWLSGGDLATVYRTFDLSYRLGFATTFSFIMIPSFSEHGWRIGCFALNKIGINTSLGDVILIPDDHIFAEEARQLPFWYTTKGKLWEELNFQVLNGAGCNPCASALLRGWRRYDVVWKDRHMSIVLSPFFPKDGGRIYKKGKGVVCDIDPCENAPSLDDNNFLFNLLNKIK